MIDINIRSLAMKVLVPNHSTTDRYINLVKLNAAIRLGEEPIEKIGQKGRILVKVPRRIWKSIGISLTTAMLRKIAHNEEFLSAFPFEQILAAHLASLGTIAGISIMTIDKLGYRLIDPRSKYIKRDVAIFGDIAIRSGYRKITRVWDLIEEAHELTGL